MFLTVGGCDLYIARAVGLTEIRRRKRNVQSDACVPEWEVQDAGIDNRSACRRVKM